MGSSKKHKDRDRDREKEGKSRKRKHRSRSRSREKDRKRERREHREERRHRREPSPEDGEIVDHSRGYQDHPAGAGAQQPPVAASRIKLEQEEAVEAPEGSNLSLSIEDTNKLRAKLGLKPLEGGPGSTAKDGESTKQEDVHKPAVNLGEQRRTAELREKMAAARQKRLINMKLGKVKTLGESDDEDGALGWVKKSRKIQQEKEQAQKTAKLLEEMDEEFGVGNLVEEEFGPSKKNYSSKDLRGMRVEHGQDHFKEGKTVILTLKDHGVLDEDDDVLTNVNIADDEHAAKNVANKKLRPDYKPWDEGDGLDEFGMMKEKEILDKYDEEIDGAKKESFQLGSGGKYNAEHERRMQEIKLALRQKGETLKLPAPVIASEFYSETEMSGFKKVKKKVRKMRKKPKMVTADDLLPLGMEGDHLGRRGQRQIKEEPIDQDLPRDLIDKSGPIPGLGFDDVGSSRGYERDAPIDPDLPREMIEKSGPIPGLDMAGGEDDMDIDKDDPMDENEILGPEEDLTGVTIEEDAAALDLELALNKARKLKHKKTAASVDRLADRIMAQAPVKQEEEEDELVDFERELVEARRKAEAEEAEGGTGWHHVEIDTSYVEIKDEDKGVLDDEPVMNEGLGGALKLADKKGYLDQETKKTVGAGKHIDLDQNYSIEDKRYDDMDDKYSRGKNRERYMGTGGMSMDFKEKDNYKPDVKLEYVDDGGRTMTPKEAFRFLSHKFHGKGSGKKKLEKRQKKIDEEMLMKSMSSTDTPLNTVALLQEKQKAEKSPYVVLSGSSKGLTSSTLSK